MPYTKQQKALFGADLARAKAGKRTRTGMSAAELKKALKEPTKRKKQLK